MSRESPMFAPPNAVPRVRYRHREVIALDGARLAVQIAGEGPAVLLANGIGVVTPGLDLLVGHLERRHRCVLWDYRGMGRSSRAPRGNSQAMAVHAADALAILEALGIERTVVLGWSMGVQVGLEMIRARPDAVAGFGALFGGFGRPFLHAFPRPLGHALDLLVRAARIAPLGVEILLRSGAALPPVTWHVCRAAGFVGPHADPELFHRNVCAVSSHDVRVYLETLIRLNEHDARDLLPRIRCPVLVAAGLEDRVTPPEVGAAMASLIPGATLLRLPETSHFGVIEHGDALLGPIEELIERSIGRAGSGPAAAIPRS